MTIEKIYTRSFLTGSHAYGTPDEESDIDLVVLMTEQEAEKLAELARENRESADQWIQDAEYAKHTPQMFCVRFGILNLIICTEEYQYDTWKKGTKRLRAVAPVPRNVAVELFAKLRREDARKLSQTGTVGPKSGIKPGGKPVSADEARRRLDEFFPEAAGPDDEIPF